MVSGDFLLVLVLKLMIEYRTTEPFQGGLVCVIGIRNRVNVEIAFHFTAKAQFDHSKAFPIRLFRHGSDTF